MRNANSASRLIVWVAFLLTTASLLPLAQASVLAPGGIVPPSPLFPAGILVASFSGQVTTIAFSTTYSQWVFSDPINTWCSNCLDFVYQFTDLGPGSNKRFEMSSFAGFNTDVGTYPFGVNDPVSIDRSTNGALIGFNYSPAILAGDTTPWLVIETDACASCFALVGNSINVLGRVGDPDGVVQLDSAYEPVAVPEPASVAMLGGGLTMIGALLRKLKSEKAG